MTTTSTDTFTPSDVKGVLVAMLPVSDIAHSAVFYRDLLGLEYRREFNHDGVVTGCTLSAPGTTYGISLRRRDTTQGKADLRDEHPLVMQVCDRAALERVLVHAQRLGLDPIRGEHPDAAWVEVRDPDGICTRFAVASRLWNTFWGIRHDADGQEVTYNTPILDI